MSGGKILKRVLVGIPIFLLALLIVGVLLLRTQWFTNRFLLAKIIQHAEQSTGARIQVQKLDLRWSPFTADLYGVVVHGKEGPNESPLLQAEQLGVSLGLRALLHNQVDLYSITVDRPILAMRVDSHGNSNLPTPPPSQSSSSNMAIVVRHASLRDGVIHYNDYQTPLAAELDDLRALAEYDAPSGMYRGSLGYRQGRIVTNGMNPVPHTAQIQFAANKDGIQLNPATIASGRTHLNLHAAIANFADPTIEGHYDGVLVTGEVAEILRNPSIPRGEISVNGEVRYHSAPNQPFLKSIQLQGNLASRSLAVRADPVSTSVQAIHGTYRLQDANLLVQKLEGNLFGGHLSARAEMRHLDTTPASTVNASLRGVSLEKLSDALPADKRQNVRLLGRANLTAQANWSKDISALNARSHIDITGPATLPPNQPAALPVNGNISVAYDGAQQRASFGKSQIRIAQTELMLNGEISRTAQLNIDLNAKDLHELSTLAAAFSAPPAASTENASQAGAYDLHGTAHFTGQVTGSTQDPRIKGQLSAANLRVQGSDWRTLRAALEATSSGAQLQNGYLESAHQGQISFSGRAALNHWSFAPENSIALQAKLTRLSVADLERLAKAQYPVSGDLSGDIAVSGSALQPLGHGNLQLAKGLAWGEPVQALSLDFHGDKDSVQSTALLRLAAGSTNAKLTYVPRTQHYEVTLNTDGLKLDQLQAAQQRGGISGTLTANVSGQGTVKDPQLSANLEIPDLQVSGQKFSGVKAQVDLAHQHANATLDSVVAQGFVHAKGSVELTGAYETNANIDVRALPIGPLLAQRSATTGTTQDLQGFTEIHASLNGPLKEPARLQGRVEIPRLNFAYQNIQLANDGPLRITYRNGVATIEQARIRGTGSDLTLQGVVPVQSAVPLNVSAKGALDVTLLQLASPDIHSSGKVELDLRAGGALKQPQTQGTIRIVNTGLSVEGAPTTVSGLNGQLSIAGNQLKIDKLEGVAGGGKISANGSATYGKETNFAVDLHAKEVRLRPNGIRSTMNADLQLNGTPQKSQLNGQVVVDRLSFQEGFDLATFVSQLSDASTVSAPSAFASNMNLGISLQSAQNLNPTSSQVSIAGSANLNVTGTAANPVILGRVNLTSGELFFQGKRFEIENGTIAFTNPAKTEAVLNLYVKTVVEQYNITINFAGPMDRLKTNYTSDPSLPPVDIINLLAFGKTSAEKANDASAPASLAAQSVVAQGVAGQVAKGVQNLTGISQLTIDPTAGNNQNPGAQVAIQQRVTGSILFTFSTDVTNTQKQSVQLQYSPKKQWKISVLRDEYGGYGIDVRLHKVF